MKERVKELAEFHSLNINLMQAIYEDIIFLKKEWVGLTDSEKKDICQEAANEDWTDLDVINATEAKLKDKT